MDSKKKQKDLLIVRDDPTDPLRPRMEKVAKDNQRTLTDLIKEGLEMVLPEFEQLPKSAFKAHPSYFIIRAPKIKDHLKRVAKKCGRTMTELQTLAMRRVLEKYGAI